MATYRQPLLHCEGPLPQATAPCLTPALASSPAPTSFATLLFSTTEPDLQGSPGLGLLHQLPRPHAAPVHLDLLEHLIVRLLPSQYTCRGVSLAYSVRVSRDYPLSLYFSDICPALPAL